VSNRYDVGVATRPRTRLDVDARRAQLIEIGLELFSSRPYDEVWIEEVAQRAGVSRGLLYHYFPTKRDFYVAVVRSVSDTVRDLAEPDPGLPPLARLRASIDAYIDFAEQNRHGMLTTHRAAIGADPEVRAILAGNQAEATRRIVAQVAGGAEVPATLTVAINGWLRLMSSSVVDWLESPSVERGLLRDFLTNAFVALVFAARGADPELDARLPPPPTE
jgi:AcrR family transcriptional regulator